MAVKKCIECVKEFLLGPLLATQKLDVINQKKIGLAITLPELDQTDSAIDEQRVVCARRSLRHGKTRRVRNLIVRTDHKRFKCVPWIESGDCCTWFCGARQFFQNFFQWRGLQRCLRADS